MASKKALNRVLSKYNASIVSVNGEVRLKCFMKSKATSAAGPNDTVQVLCVVVFVLAVVSCVI